MANNELLDKVITLVEADAATENGTRWDQSSWGRVYAEDEVKAQGLSCGTAGCFAGWAVQLAGGKFHLGEIEKNALAMYGEAEVSDCILPGDDVLRSIPSAAADLLRITLDQADWLFNGNNDSHDLRRMVELLKINPDADLSLIYDDYSDEDF